MDKKWMVKGLSKKAKVVFIMNLNSKEKAMIKRFLMEEISPSIIILFGSSVKGNLRSDSDVDIAFFTENEYPDDKVFLLSQKLASLLGRDVDLVNLQRVSTVFQAQIVGEGEIIYAKDYNMLNELFIRILKQYVILNEERKPILERIGKEGSVYG